MKYSRLAKHPLFVRVSLIPLSLVAGILTTRLLLTKLGLHDFSTYFLFTTFLQMFSFLDLGFTAGMMNATGLSQQHKTLDFWEYFLKSAKRILSVGFVLILSSGGLILLPSFRSLFAHGNQYGKFVFFSLPLGIFLYTVYRICFLSYSALFASRQSTKAFLLQFLSSGLNLILVFSISVSNLAGNKLFFYILTPIVSQLIPSMIALLVMFRSRLKFSGLSEPVVMKSHALPMFAIMIISPFLPFLERTFILRIGTASELGMYSVIRQLISPYQSILESARAHLWGREMNERLRSDRDRSYWILRLTKTSAFGCCIGLLCFVSSWVLIPIVDKKHEIRHIDFAFIAFIAVSVALSYLYLPVSTFLTDPLGLKKQVIFVSFNVILECVLIPSLLKHFHLAGLGFAIVISVLVSTTIPGWLQIFRKIGH